MQNIKYSDSPESTLSLNSVEGEDRYRLLFELSPSGIILEDQEGIILDVNEAFCRSIGYRRKELIGKHVGILAHPDVKNQVDDNISRLLSGKVLKHNEKSVRKDGSICYMELHETKVILPDGGIGILCVADDHTEQDGPERIADTVLFHRRLAGRDIGNDGQNKNKNKTF